ncbi:unnamed protein product [Zymoseptoria tritici ST99CH_3D1]|nr:unnamed protein product [Zymoseptoria tritici ST99CH_3D1]
MPSLLTRLRSSYKSLRSALLPTGDAISSTPLLDMFAHNWHLGLTCFGGPTVHFQIFQELFVEKYKWIDAATYQEMFALCQALSGPASTKMIYAINVLHYGLAVGVGSFFVWSLPMAIAAFGLGLGVGNIGEELPAPVYALLSGLNSATVGIIALAAVQLSNKAITDTLTRCLVFLGGTAGMLYNALWYYPVLMAAGGIVTVIFDLKLVQRAWRKLSPRQEAPPPEEVHHSAIEMGSIHHSAEPRASTSNLHARTSTIKTPTDPTEPTAAVSHQSVLAEEISTPPTPVLSSWKLATAIITAFFASFITVMVCCGTFGGANRGFDLFSNLYLAGTIIFGGGPVVIPLLREYIVTPGFVSPRDFILGLAITQAFPGPNFNFAVYCGTLAVQGSRIPPVVGAMIGYVGIFLPGMWLHTGFIGLWSSVRKVQVVRALLRGIHASAVGLVFTAVYRIFQIGYLDGENQNGASLSRDPWWLVIVATSFVGGMHFGVSPPMAVGLGSVMGLVWFGVTKGLESMLDQKSKVFNSVARRLHRGLPPVKGEPNSKPALVEITISKGNYNSSLPISTQTPSHLTTSNLSFHPNPLFQLIHHLRLHRHTNMKPTLLFALSLASSRYSTQGGTHFRRHETRQRRRSRGSHSQRHIIREQCESRSEKTPQHRIGR